MKFAAIDIGSNAVRLLIEEVHEHGNQYHIQKVSFTRVPLRLGDDVFQTGKISDNKIQQLIKTMKAFWYLMDVHSIEHFRACATSAMREAENRDEILELVKLEANLEIEVIDGRMEAALIFGNFKVSNIEKEKNYLYIDVGGGSTELTLIKNGKRSVSRSFRIGTVRMLIGKVKEKWWTEAEEWISNLMKEEDNVTAIGTGGNINKIHKEAGKKSFAVIRPKEIKAVYNYMKKYTYEERIYKLKLKPDRADVIIPAAEIYMNMMKYAGIKEMIVPKVGLSDGIILWLYKRWKRSQKATAAG